MASDMLNTRDALVSEIIMGRGYKQDLESFC